MTLNHVAQGAGGFIEAAASLDAEGFCCGDLHMIDVVAVPERLEDAIAKTEDQEILHGVFAEIVVDAIDLLLFKDVMDNFVEFPCGGEVTAERLFNDDADPGF